MIRWKLRAAFAALCLFSPPFTVGAQRVSGDKTVLFVCEHGTVKSLLAKILVDEYARQSGLRMQAVSRGTHVDSVTPDWMVQALAKDHVNLGAWHPQGLRAEDLATAAFVVSFDVPREATAGTHAPRSQWDSVPSVTQNFERGREAIKARVHQLVDSLKRSENVGRP